MQAPAQHWEARAATWPGDGQSMRERIASIGKTVARPASRDVDAQARFPVETITALREHGLLGAAVPVELGGGGAGLRDLAAACTALAQHCTSSAMILAMHHIQVLSIVRHRGVHTALDDYLAQLVREQRLIASVTSEAGVGGDLRQSIAALESGAAGLSLRKQATTVSYAQHADDFLITARRSAEAAPGDQVAVLSMAGQHRLVDVGNWNPLGMRGTCSPPALVETTVQGWQVLPEDFADVAARTMVPTSHMLWASCWLGIALDALATARAVVRRRKPVNGEAVPAGGEALGDLALDVQGLADALQATLEDYEQIVLTGDESALGSLAFAQRINNLKLAASRKVVAIVTDAIALVGMGAFLNDSPVSLGRQLRDAHSAPLMINNARLEQTNASLALMQR